MVNLPPRFIHELDTYISQAEAGDRPDRARQLLEYFAQVAVSDDGDPDRRVIAYLARAIDRALADARARAIAKGKALNPADIDVGKALGLVRARSGTPTSGARSDEHRREIGQDYATLIASGAKDADARRHIAKKHGIRPGSARRYYDDYLAESNFDLGRTIYGAVQKKLDVAGAEWLNSKTVETKVIAEHATQHHRSPVAVRKAYRAYRRLVGRKPRARESKDEWWLPPPGQ